MPGPCKSVLQGLPAFSTKGPLHRKVFVSSVSSFRLAPLCHRWQAVCDRKMKHIGKGKCQQLSNKYCLLWCFCQLCVAHAAMNRGAEAQRSQNAGGKHKHKCLKAVHCAKNFCYPCPDPAAALPHAQSAMGRVCLALKLLTSILKTSIKERESWNVL